MRKLAFLFAMMLLTVPGISMGVEEIITGPDWESPFVDPYPNDPFDNTDDDLSFTLTEAESGHASLTMTLTSATVTFDPKKKDKFVLKGTTGSLSLTGAQSVIFEAGAFKQEITLDKFTKSKEKYTFKGAAGAAGIASLILDMPKGQFSATVQNLFLTGITNPLPVSLKAGTSAECSMAQFEVSKNKWTFSGSGNPQFACLITQVPKATPLGLFVNTPKNITVQAQVPSNKDLKADTVQLLQVDDGLNPVGNPLCALLDNGNSANGDQKAGDNVYSCMVTLQESSPGKVYLMVSAQLGGEITYSPSFSLEVVTPYTQEQAQQTVTAHGKAGQTWQDNLTKYGNTKKARDETVKAVKKIDGVKDAGVSTDGSSIWIEFKSGIRGGVILDAADAGSPSETTPVRKKAERISPTLDRVCGSALDLSENGNPSGGLSQPGNCGVFLWDTREYDDHKISDYEILFGNQTFSINDHFGLDCTVASLREMTGFETVIMHTGARKGRSSHVYGTWDTVTLQNLQDEKFMLDLLTGCLEAWLTGIGTINYYFTPNFISTLEGGFSNSIVYVESDFSADLAFSFLGKKAHTFFGYSAESDNAWMIDTGKKLFTSMVKDGKDTGEAYSAVPERSKGSSYFLKYSNSTTEIDYNGCKEKTGSASIETNLYAHIEQYDSKGNMTYEQWIDWLFFWPSNYLYTNVTGKFTGSVFSGTWDYSDQQNNRWYGTTHIALADIIDKNPKVISFSADEYNIWGNGSRSIYKRIDGVGGELPIATRKTTTVGNQSYDTYIFEVKGTGTCSSFDSNSIYYEIAPLDPNVAVPTFVKESECSSNSRLTIQIDLRKN